jgi:Mesyanzhinovviridae DNA primase
MDHSGPNPQQPLKPDLDMAVNFLKALRPGGPWVLTAIHPDKKDGDPDKIITRTFADLEKARGFIAGWNSTHNLHYNFNRTKNAVVSKKPGDVEMAEVDFVHGDLDPNAGENLSEVKPRYRAQIANFHKPTFLVDSGSGIQALWGLEQPLGPTHFKAVRNRCRAVMKYLGADDLSACDPSRVLRLPGTINYPSPAKRAKGRVVCLSHRIIEEADDTLRYKLDDFPIAPDDPKDHSGQEFDYDIDTLPISERMRNLIKGIDDPDHPYNSRSARMFAVLVAMAGAGCSDDEMRAVMRGQIGDHIRDQGNPETYLEKQIADAREKVVDPLTTAMNKTYALVIVGDKTPILKTPQKGFQFLTVSAFEQWHANRFIHLGKKKDGTPIQWTVAKYWLSHPQRRQYEGITFAPNREVPGYYNVWKGFAVVPKQGDCSKFLAHLRDNVCDGNDALYDWVVGWFAHIFRTPADKSGTSLVLRGVMGVGKTKVGEVIGSLLGEHFVLASEPRYITGRFNSHLVTCLLLQADEGFWAGDHSAEGKLRDLITGHHHFIEFKGKEPIRVANFVRLFVTGNAEWIVPAGFDERRFAVLDVAPHKKQDHAYFAAIDAEMNNGGREALLHHLLNLDLSKVNLRAIPQTVALLEQKISSLTPEAGWLLDILNRGELPWGCEGSGVCPTKRLIEDYIAHASKRGRRRRAIETSLGMFLFKHVPGLRKIEGAYNIWTGEEMKLVPGYLYQFPPLSQCRVNFAKLLNQDPLWSERQEWQVTPQLGEDAPF